MAIPTILQGDTSAIVRLAIEAGDFAGCALDVTFHGVTRTFSPVQGGATVSLEWTPEETASFPLGTGILTMTVRRDDSVRTLPFCKIKVTDAPAEVYDCAITIDPGIAFVDELPERFTENDMRTKINQILSCMKRCVAFFAFLTIASEAAAATVLTAPKGEIYNDAPVVTNVSFEGLLPKVCGPLKLDWSQRYSEDVLSLKAPAFPMYWLTMTPEQIVINGPEEHSTSILAAYIRINHAYYYADCISLPYGDLKYPAKGGTFAVLSDIDAATNTIPQVVTNVVRAVVEGEISPDNAAFSNAVLSVGIGIDTNAVAAINALLDGEDNALPVGGAATVGGLLAALAAALAALKKKVMEKYPFVDTAIVDGVVTFTPYSRNALTSDGTAFTVLMGGSNTHLRDCVFVVTAGSTAPTISWGEKDGQTFSPRTDSATDMEIAANTTKVFWVSEYAPDCFVVAGWEVPSVSE